MAEKEHGGFFDFLGKAGFGVVIGVVLGNEHARKAVGKGIQKGAKWVKGLFGDGEKETETTEEAPTEATEEQQPEVDPDPAA